MRWKRIGLNAGIAVLVLVAAVVAFLVHLESTRRGPFVPKDVPPEWQDFKTGQGHRVHVEERGVACKECHDYERDGFVRPDVATCNRCHEKQAAHEHLGDDATKTDCLTCHSFAPKAAPTCISCHSETHGKSAAIGTHSTADCTKCHDVHATPMIAPGGCESCHKEVAPEHAKHGGSRGCLDCHTGHAPAAAARDACPKCHSSPATPHPASHESCLGCHQPHTFVAGGEEACRRCHGDKPTLAATKVRDHATCTSCHTPHSPTQAPSSCAGCHESVHTSHPQVNAGPNGSVCTTCHKPHADPKRDAIACTNCHSKEGKDEHAKHGGGVACTSCHAQHDFGSPTISAGFCNKCHSSEATLASLNPGHAACDRCHGNDAHAPAKPPPCATCHATENASAPAGHRACTNCHDKHSGERSPTKTCPTCHTKEGSDLHATKVGSCTTCHRPHGPKGPASPPTCTTCHQPQNLPGMHEASGHKNCASCHTPHEPPRADRATCTACHADRKQHQPQASACNGCHVFH